jgi:aminomethyltransferase
MTSSATTEPSPRKTPLYALHRSEGGRIVPFAGYAMPVEYTGILAEHRAVRSSAGLFDVSHMGEARLRGPDALRLAQFLLCNDVANAAPGRVRYGLLCREDGTTVDDVTAYRTGPDEVLFCLNASNTAKDLAWILSTRDAGSFDCEVIDESEATALLAIQGPRALEIAHQALGDAEKPPGRWRFREQRWGQYSIRLSRTGYTGEDGYEIYVPSEGAAELWTALRKAGGDALVPAGLGARDTLRTEMAYPLYGHELDDTTNPIEAGLERFVAFGAGFHGERALAAVREQPVQRLVGLLVEGRSAARPPSAIRTPGGVGRVTSGSHAPSIERSIAIGYVPAQYAALGTALAVEIRGREVPCRVCATPFFQRS